MKDKKTTIKAKLENTYKREPVVIIGAVVALVEAVIGLLVAFGIDMTPEQSQAVIALTVAIAPAIGYFITVVAVRPKVTPVAAPRTEADEAAAIVPTRQAWLMQSVDNI